MGDPGAVQAATADPGKSRCLRTAIGDGSRAPSFCLLAESDEAVPEFASDNDCGIVFDGVLYNRIELGRQRGTVPA